MIIIKNHTIFITMSKNNPSPLSMHLAVSAIKRASDGNDLKDYLPISPPTPQTVALQDLM